MGGKSATTTTQQVKTGLPAAQAPIESILGGVQGLASSPTITGAQTGALDALQANANAGNPFASGISNYANLALSGGGPDRSGMVTDALKSLQGGLSGTANGDYLDPSKNPWFNQVTSTIGNDVQNRINAMYAGSGRDASGAGSYGYNLGRGIAEGTAPTFANAYQTERGNQINAQNTLYGASSGAAGLLSGLDQSRLAAMGQGVTAAGQANQAANYGPLQTLAIESQRSGIPISILQQLAGIAGPLSQTGGTINGSSTTPPPPTNWGQLAAGTAIAGLGAFSGNPMMMAQGAGQVAQGSNLFGNYGATPSYAGQMGNWWQQAGQGSGPWAAG